MISSEPYHRGASTSPQSPRGSSSTPGRTVAPDCGFNRSSDVIEPLAGKIAEAVTRFFGSDPQHSDSFGRIINARHFDRLTARLPDP